ncbi:MAG TPA: PQQ-binding-like beta-propeller repeat protein [Ktedonobacteraceae bacterium]|nr:PQQ-binding-like beta-propeller repeat protein [Ktedonobacteraceae bacterium]
MKHFFSGKQPWKLRSFLIFFIGLAIVLATVIVSAMMPKTNAHADTGDWTTFLGSNARTSFNANETVINPSTAPNLTLSWTHMTNGTITAQPIVSNGVLYWGSWDGHERATNLKNQKGLWSKNLGITVDKNAGCHPTAAGVASTATVATVSINGQNTQVVFVGGGDAIFYALNASNGSIIWHTKLGLPPATFLWSSPAFYNGDIYEGVASFGDCPLVQGQIVQMDAATGAILNVFKTVPDGCTGATVWGSVAIDESTGMLYFGTGNAGACKHETLALSLVELNALDLSLVASWRVPNLKGDNDFGSTPTLFDATINGTLTHMVGLINKNRTYYAFDRTNIAAGPLWQDQISSAGDNISSSAWDGTNLYIAGNKTTINGTTCAGSIRAVNPANGSYIWQDCIKANVQDPVMAVPGLIVIGAGTDMLVISTADGSILFDYHLAPGHATFLGPATISNGVLYIGNNDGCLYAFTPSS